MAPPPLGQGTAAPPATCHTAPPRPMKTIGRALRREGALVLLVARSVDIGVGTPLEHSATIEACRLSFEESFVSERGDWDAFCYCIKSCSKYWEVLGK